MTAANLPPLHAPSEAPQAKSPPPRPRHDFATHLQTSQGRALSARGAVPTQAPAALENELASVRELLTETVQPSAGGKIYAQSLHVVGYLSMLAVHGTAGTGVTLSRGAIGESVADDVVTSPADAAEASGDVAPAYSTGAAGLIVALQPAVGMSSDESAASVAEVASASLAEPSRFARRRLQVIGDTLFLRDFTLSPAQAKAVLDRMREHFGATGEANNAVVNGTSYSLLRTNGYVG